MLSQSITCSALHRKRSALSEIIICFGEAAVVRRPVLAAAQTVQDIMLSALLVMLSMQMIYVTAALQSSPPLVNAAGPPPPPPTITAHALPTAQCIDGAPATVWANASAATTWVIQVGPGSGGAGMFCFTDPSGKPTGQSMDCPSLAARPQPTPTAPPKPASLGAGGIQDLNCTRNPTFCKAAFAQLSTCSYDMLLGDAEHTIPYRWNGSKVLNTSTTFKLQGQLILKESLQKLGELGLKGAESVILTGETHGGTTAALIADKLAELLKTIAPKVKKFKVLPADGIHPRFASFQQNPHPPAPFSFLPCDDPKQQFAGHSDCWFQNALVSLASIANATAALDPQCITDFPANNSYRCFGLNASYISTPLFAVQQMPATWDYQCNFDGRLRPFLECSDHSSYMRQQYMCVQYPDLCSPVLVANYTVPLQKAYVKEYTANSMHKKHGNGGFFFSCFLGSYWEMLFDDNMVGAHTNPLPKHSLDAVWNQLSIDGTTMRQAIDKWWNADASKEPGPWLQDTYWDPAGKPPAPPHHSDVGQHDHLDANAPPVPWYTSRFFTNPSCRGFPWY